MRAALAVTALLLAAPTVHAGLLFDDPVVVNVPPLRAGDRLVYGGTEAARIVLVEGASVVLDGFGVERDTVAYREDFLGDGTVVSASRCHVLAGGSDVVRTEWLVSSPASGSGSAQASSTLFGIPVASSQSTSSMNATLTFGWGCVPPEAPRTSRFTEGERTPIRDVLPGADVEDDLLVALPATATTFHGRPALILPYEVTRPDAADGAARVELTFADGLPVVVAIRVIAADGASAGPSGLSGFEAGDGDEVPRPGAAALPERNPSATFGPYPRLALDDAPFRLPFSYAAAFAAIRDDPRTGLAAFLAANPTANLARASFDREATTALDMPGMQREGIWMIEIVGDAEVFSGYAARHRAVGPAGDAQPDAAKFVQASGTTFPDSQWWGRLHDLPAEAATATDILALAMGEGLEGVTTASFYVISAPGSPPHVSWTLADVGGDAGSETGHAVVVNLLTGGVETVYDATATSWSGGLLSPPSTSSEAGLAAPASRSAFEALAGVPPGFGLAGGAAATAAVLFLLAKLLLVPLFTRLRRDRLLDNPVRARAYERIRAEPGIHRAELVDFLAIGEGATRHHLAQLVRHRLVVETSMDGFVRYFAAGEVPPETARREAVLRAGSLRRVYDLDAGEPGLSLREAAARLGMSAPSVHRARRKLLAAGLLPAPPAAVAARVESEA